MSYKRVNDRPYFRAVGWTQKKISSQQKLSNYFRKHEMPVSIYSDIEMNPIYDMHHPITKKKHYYTLSRQRHQFFTVIK